MERAEIARHPGAWIVLAFALFAVAPRPLWAQSGSTAEPAVVSASPPAVEAEAGVRPGDWIDVWVWREEDLSGRFPVDSRGTVVLPKLGAVDVAGTSGEALAQELTDRYARYLRNPSIRVTVLRRIAVQGHVAKPGLYPVDATISVADVIALAGGVVPNGNARGIRLLRDGRVIVTGLEPATILERSPVQSGDEVFVPEKGWLARNSGTLLWGAVSVAGAIAVTLVTR